MARNAVLGDASPDNCVRPGDQGESRERFLYLPPGVLDDLYSISLRSMALSGRYARYHPTKLAGVPIGDINCSYICNACRSSSTSRRYRIVLCHVRASYLESTDPISHKSIHRFCDIEVRPYGRPGLDVLGFELRKSPSSLQAPRMYSVIKLRL